MVSLGKKEDSLIQLTKWTPKQELHETMLQGVTVSIPYERWCNNEAVRISKDPARKVEVRDNVTKKKCALFVDDVGDHTKPL